MVAFVIYISLVLACLATYWLNRQTLPPYLKYLAYLLAFVVVFEVIGILLDHFGFNNYFLDHIYQPVELIFLTIVYHHAIDQAFFRKAVRIAVPLVAGSSLILSLWVEGFEKPNTASFIIESTLIITYAIIYKYRLFTLPPTRESLLVNPFFWINTANLFFYCGTFLQMGLDTYIRKRNAALADQLLIINYGLNYTLYILYWIAFLCKKIFKSYLSL